MITALQKKAREETEAIQFFGMAEGRKGTREESSVTEDNCRGFDGQVAPAQGPALAWAPGEPGSELPHREWASKGREAGPKALTY